MEKNILFELQEFLDRESPSPLYLQLKNFLLERINNGQLTEGEMIPTEQEFGRLTGLSRATIRQALRELDTEGFIKRYRGSGTKVAKKRIITQVMQLSSFTDDMKIRGFIPSSRSVEVDFIFPPLKVVELSDFDPLEKVFYVRRVRLADGEPIGIHDLYIPPSLNISPTDLKNLTSYYEYLSNVLNLQPVYAIESITAMTLAKNEADLLNLRVGAPVLAIWRVAFADNNQIVEVCRMLHDAERYEYKTKLFKD